MKETGRLPGFESPLPPWMAKTPFAAIAGGLYEAVIEHRNRRFDRNHAALITTAAAPVISIGGIRAGGTGKTPSTMLVTDLLLRMGKDVAVLSRGYGRKNRENQIVSPHEACRWESVGDEPAMMHAASPELWLGIGADRSENAASLIHSMGERAVFIMDDGFQHRQLHRNLDIVCIHESVFEDRMIPCGYLREPVTGLARASLFFCITDEGSQQKMGRVCDELRRRFPATPLIMLENRFEGWVNAATGEITGRPDVKEPVALCGIARPGRFFDLLNRQGIMCTLKKTFPDHYIYRESDITALQKLYSQGFITTEKDMVRLAGFSFLPKELVWYSKIRLQVSEKDSLDTLNHYIKGSVK